MEKIQYLSTNGHAPKVSFREALLQGLAPDGGLYYPSRLPSFSHTPILSSNKWSYADLATYILRHFIDDIAESSIYSMAKEAYNFDIPVEPAGGQTYILRLDQGPTASFKDFAARMMARLMNHYLKEKNRKLHILVATSGDTGSAIANAYHGLEAIKVTVLFPLKEVSDRQRKQMTTLNGNVTIIGIDGKFDDCQVLVKKAFNDPVNRSLHLSSANSINIGRLLPQTVYYFYAWSSVSENLQPIIFSVPSGNFGNLMGGLLAKSMNLPVEKFIVATNENDEVPSFLERGIYRIISPSYNCISSAMNVGHPSNMARITQLYGGRMDEKGKLLRFPDLDRMRNDLYGQSISDEKTRETIKKVWIEKKIMMEPHGAVAWRGLSDFFDAFPHYRSFPSVVIETAHPAKFPKEIQLLTGLDPELPASLKNLNQKEEHWQNLDNNYSHFLEYLQNH